MFSNGFRQEVVLPIQHTHPCIFRVSSFPPLPLSLRSQQQQRVILFLETHSMAPWGMPRLPNGIVCWRASRPIRNSHPILAGPLLAVAFALAGPLLARGIATSEVLAPNSLFVLKKRELFNHSSNIAQYASSPFSLYCKTEHRLHYLLQYYFLFLRWFCTQNHRSGSTNRDQLHTSYDELTHVLFVTPFLLLFVLLTDSSSHLY